MGVLDKRLQYVPPPGRLPRMLRILTLLVAAVMFIVLYEKRDMLRGLMSPAPRQTTTPDP